MLSCFYVWCRCCVSKKKTTYLRTLDLVKKDIERNLDVLVVLRRLRAHGTGLTFLLDGKITSLITKISKKRQVNLANE